MKKILSILLCLILIFSFAACAKKQPVPEYPEEVTMIENMLDSRPMSQSQVVHAFTVLGYSEKQIGHILDQANVNWTAQALRAAQVALDEQPMSKSTLTGILCDAQYTGEQINYALSAINVRWEEQCLYVAMDYISQGYSKDKVMEMLTNDGFTLSEIAYVNAQHYQLVEGQ